MNWIVLISRIYLHRKQYWLVWKCVKYLKGTPVSGSEKLHFDFSPAFLQYSNNLTSIGSGPPFLIMACRWLRSTRLICSLRSISLSCIRITPSTFLPIEKLGTEHTVSWVRGNVAGIWIVMLIRLYENSKGWIQVSEPKFHQIALNSTSTVNKSFNEIL